MKAESGSNILVGMHADGSHHAPEDAIETYLFLTDFKC